MTLQCGLIQKSNNTIRLDVWTRGRQATIKIYIIRPSASKTNFGGVDLQNLEDRAQWLNLLAKIIFNYTDFYVLQIFIVNSCYR